jgi:putative spermidine/putrescine transport system permease protein
MLLNMFRRVDLTLEEAAQSLGASELRVFWHVTLPLMAPGILSAALLAFILSSVAFSSPLVLGGSSVTMVANAIYNQAVVLLNRGTAAALAVVSLLITLAVLYPAKHLERRR